LPSDLATTSCTPSISNTARVGPPAMMPVPGGAERRTTLPDPWRPSESWCNVRPSRRGTRMRLRRADSVALRIASGTSRALPWPKPTRPFWSPTTTSAAKPKRLPPLTTLATRLICTSLSENSLSLCGLRATGHAFPCVLEIEAAFARTVGQGLDAPVIAVAAPVEHHLVDARLARALGEQLADRRRRRLVGAGLELPLEVFLQARGGGHGVALRVVDHLGIDVLGRAEHGEPRPAAPAPGQHTADPLLAALELVQLAVHGRHLTSSCLPCGGCTPRDSECPCPGRARAGARRGSRPPSAPPSACRCRRPRLPPAWRPSPSRPRPPGSCGSRRG